MHGIDQLCMRYTRVYTTIVDQHALDLLRAVIGAQRL